MSDRTPDKHRMQHVGQRKISDELSSAGQQALVFPSRHGTADKGNIWKIVHAEIASPNDPPPEREDDTLLHRIEAVVRHSKVAPPTSAAAHKRDIKCAFPDVR
jgi:hypothetical protein